VRASTTEHHRPGNSVLLDRRSPRALHHLGRDIARGISAVSSRSRSQARGMHRQIGRRHPTLILSAVDDRIQVSGAELLHHRGGRAEHEHHREPQEANRASQLAARRPALPGFLMHSLQAATGFFSAIRDFFPIGGARETCAEAGR